LAEGGVNDTDSLMNLYLEEVMPVSYLREYHRGHGHSDRNENVFIQCLEWFFRYDLFSGVVTMNDVYAVIPQDYKIVKFSNYFLGTDLLKVTNRWNDQRLSLENITDVVAFSMEHLNTTRLQQSVFGIDNNTRYSLYALSKDAPAIKELMMDLGIIKSSISTKNVFHVDKTRTIRNMWIDFVRNNWPYDGNQCQCIKNNTCALYNNTNGKNHKSSSSSTSNKINVPSPIDPELPVSTSKHHNPSKTNSHTSRNRSSNNDDINGIGVMAILWIVTATSIVIFFVIRSRRRGYSIQRDARDVGRSNDLELEVVPPPPGYGDMSLGGYCSPHVSSANFV